MKRLDEADGDLVGAVVVVAVGRELAVDRRSRRPGRRSSRTGVTVAYLIADSESAATERPAMPQAMVRRTSRSCSAISRRS